MCEHHVMLLSHKHSNCYTDSHSHTHVIAQVSLNCAGPACMYTYWLAFVQVLHVKIDFDSHDLGCMPYDRLFSSGR